MSNTAPTRPPVIPPVEVPRPALRSERALCFGVIVWSDDPEVEPTVIADRNPVTLARAVAITIHEMLEDSDAYAGATEFLTEHPPPQDWVLPEDVDDWLEALREATPHPAYSFHQIPLTGGADGTNHTVVNRHLQQALRDRERALTADAADASPEGRLPGRAPAPASER